MRDPRRSTTGRPAQRRPAQQAALITLLAFLALLAALLAWAVGQ